MYQQKHKFSPLRLIKFNCVQTMFKQCPNHVQTIIPLQQTVSGVAQHLPGTVFNLTATGGNVVGLSLTEAGSSVVREIRVFDNPNLAVTFDAGGLPPNLTVLLAADTLLSVEGLASNLPLALQEISLANTPSTLSGPAGNLPANLTYFNVSYSNVAVVGNASDWPAGLTSLSMSYTGSELNGPSADWPAGLEKLVMRVDSASAQVSTDTLPVSLIYLDVSLNDNTDVLVGPTLSAPDLNRLYLRQTVNTTVDVDGLLAQLDTDLPPMNWSIL